MAYKSPMQCQRIDLMHNYGIFSCLSRTQLCTHHKYRQQRSFNILNCTKGTSCFVNHRRNPSCTHTFRSLAQRLNCRSYISLRFHKSYIVCHISCTCQPKRTHQAHIPDNSKFLMICLRIDPDCTFYFNIISFDSILSFHRKLGKRSLQRKLNSFLSNFCRSDCLYRNKGLNRKSKSHFVVKAQIDMKCMNFLPYHRSCNLAHIRCKQVQFQ